MSDEQNDKETLLNVYGRGVSSAEPDHFSIHFAIRCEDPDDEYCYRVVVEKADRMLKALKGWAADHDMIRTTSFSYDHFMLSEKRGAWPKGKVLAAVAITIYVESGRIDDIAGLIALARRNEASEISDVTFRLSDSLRRAEREKALRAAAEAARSDAAVTADAFGMTVAGLSRVDILNGFDHDTYSDRYCCDSETSELCRSSGYGREDMMPSEFIEAGEVTTSVCIDAVFRLSR